MTIAMETMHRRLPPREQYPLPPREITTKLAATVSADALGNERRLTAATLAAHFGFGVITGGLYPLLFPKRPIAPALSGMVYGIAVWAISYLGWIPALGILRPATQHPPRRNALMLAAHLVWGATLGIATDRLAARP